VRVPVVSTARAHADDVVHGIAGPLCSLPLPCPFFFANVCPLAHIQLLECPGMQRQKHMPLGTHPAFGVLRHGKTKTLERTLEGPKLGAEPSKSPTRASTFVLVAQLYLAV
jgi:hypothetical protein